MCAKVCSHTIRLLSPRIRPANVTVEHIADLLGYELPVLLAGHQSKPSAMEVNTMKATELLHNLGQSLWLDNVTRDLLASGSLQRYIDELSVTGLTSNPTMRSWYKANRARRSSSS